MEIIKNKYGDKSMSEDDTIPFNSARNLRLSKNHLILDALNKYGSFKPVYKGIVTGFSKETTTKLPLIWQKIK